MSRWSLDDDDRAWDDEPRPNATCTDCALSYSKAEDDPSTTCDACSDRRDAWATATETRMAKAALPIAEQPQQPPDPGIIDVALVPLEPRDPAGYLAWLDALRANANYGPDALAHAWYIAPPDYTRHLLTATPDHWIMLKAIARRVA